MADQNPTIPSNLPIAKDPDTTGTPPLTGGPVSSVVPRPAVPVVPGFKPPIILPPLAPIKPAPPAVSSPPSVAPKPVVPPVLQNRPPIQAPTPVIKPPVATVVPAAPATPPVSSTPINLKSSIRTMGGDVKSLQSGQAPKGVEVKIPSAPSQAAQVQPSTATPVAPKPAPPSISVKLGELEKRTPSPLAPAPRPAVPLAPKPPEQKVGITAPTPATGIKIPTKSMNLSSLVSKRNLAILGVVVVLAGAGYWFAVRQPAIPEITATPTPTGEAVSPTPFETGPRLSPIFNSFYSFSTPLSENSISFLHSEITRVSDNDGSKNILMDPQDESAQNYGFAGFLNKFSINYPTNLESDLDEKDFDLLITKQKETFDSEGKPIASPSAELLKTPRTALISRVTDSEDALGLLLDWEDTLYTDIKGLLNLPDQEEAVTDFLDNSYREVNIRYVNFPYPDWAIDYAIITATDNNDYLVIANSREQMYAIIDALLGF